MNRKRLVIITIGVLLFSGGKLVEYFLTYHTVEKQTEVIQTEREKYSYVDLRAKYKHNVGWIKIPDTKIDYPIMQGDNNEFYLTHNYNGEKLRAGSIFLDYRNSPDFTDQHTIIYGHDLRNGSMFGQLDLFADQAFASAHQTFQLEVGKEVITLQLYAAYETTTDFYYIETDFTKQTFEAFLQEIKQKSIIDVNTLMQATDQLVTLSTCTSSVNEKERFVVHAKIVERIGQNK